MEVDNRLVDADVGQCLETSVTTLIDVHILQRDDRLAIDRKLDVLSVTPWAQIPPAPR
jgi:hypothetical protein